MTKKKHFTDEIPAKNESARNAIRCVFHMLGLKSKDDVRKAIISGDLDPNKTRGYGKMMHVCIKDWLQMSQQTINEKGLSEQISRLEMKLKFIESRLGLNTDEIDSPPSIADLIAQNLDD